LSRPLLPGLDFDDRPALQEASPGEPHALQDHGPRTPGPVPGALRGAPGEEEHTPSPGPLFDRPQSQPRFLDGPARPGEARERTQPDCERSPGARNPGAPEPSVNRIAEGPLGVASFPRRSHGLYPGGGPPLHSASQPSRLATRARPSSTQPL